MTESIMAEISKQYRRTHEDLLNLVDGLTDEQIVWTPNATTPSIGFHVWHVARWTDYLQEMINGRGSQLWEKEGLAARWALETDSLGLAETGTFMEEKVAMTLPMPGKSLLLDYARRAFAIAQQTVGAIGDDQYYQIYEDLHGENWHEGRIGPIITAWMKHDSEHLGMIECLVGVQGMRGTAND
jgi:hypothetical protein